MTTHAEDKPEKYEKKSQDAIGDAASASPEDAPPERTQDSSSAEGPSDRSRPRVCLPLPGLSSALLELAVHEDDCGAFISFVRAGAEQRFSRSYLADLTTGGPVPLRSLSLVIQRHDYMDEDDASGVPNPVVERLWEDEHARLLSFSRDEGDSGIVRYFPLPSSRDGTLAVFPPILYEKTRRVFFHPGCPLCGGLLRDCRDNRLLAMHGLGQFTETNKRYLFCAACAEKNPEAVKFYRRLPTEAEQLNGVGSEFDLYYDIREAAAATPHKSVALTSVRPLAA